MLRRFLQGFQQGIEGLGGQHVHLIDEEDVAPFQIGQHSSQIARFLKDLIPSAERARIENQGVDLDAVFANLDSGVKGKLVDVEDVQDGHLIEIWIE